MQAMRAGSLFKFSRLERGRRALLMRAAVALSAASAAVAWLPFRRAIRFGSVDIGLGRRGSPELCVWAVETIARRVPWRAMCIEKGLAVQRLLRANGTDARLHYGARRDAESGTLQAHVWVTVDGHAVIGGEVASEFAELACYP